MASKIGGSVMVLLGIGCFCFSLYYLCQEVLLDATGQPTTGVVTERSTSTDENNNISYYISYSYEDGNEHQYTSKSDASKSMYDSNSEGTQIRVVYSSTFPSISRIRSTGEYLWPTGMFAAIGGVTLGFGLRMILTGKMD